MTRIDPFMGYVQYKSPARRQRSGDVVPFATCGRCARRVWMNVSAPDGTPLGPAYRCEIKGPGAWIKDDSPCDINEFVRRGGE